MTISKKTQEIVDNPCVSEKTLKGITFSSDDRQFLKRQYDGIALLIKDKFDENLKYLSEIIISNNALVFKELQGIKEEIGKINTKIVSMEDRIKQLETRLDDYYLRLKNHKHEL